jgi:hypothetical protein
LRVSHLTTSSTATVSPSFLAIPLTTFATFRPRKPMAVQNVIHAPRDVRANADDTYTRRARTAERERAATKGRAKRATVRLRAA